LKNIVAKSAVAGTVLLLSASAASATAIDVQFDATASQRQTGAAVIGAAGDYWNYSSAASGTNSLVDTSQAATGVSVTFAASGVYRSTNGAFTVSGSPYANLMQGYLYASGTSTITLTLKGLAAGQGYSLDFYTQGDASSSGHSSAVTVNGVTATSTQTNAGTFIQGNNYLVFSGAADALGYVSIGVMAKNGEADVNGFQLVTTVVPEPSTLALVGAALASLGFLSRRRPSA